MTYQALYRKWRPAVFEDIVGQDHIINTIMNQIKNNKIAHAYLFCGSRGTGKTSTAKIFSRAVNCENPTDGNPCNKCNSCLGILNNSIFDVVEIDGASNNKVDDVRSLRDDIVYPPTDVKYKVYIIDEVHMLTTEAFNALLKTLEEPPSYIIFILATTEFHKIPATIISRCQKFDFKRITYKDTAQRIEKVAKSDNINITPSAINLLAKAADGSLRDGLSKLDQCNALGKSLIEYKDVALIIGASDPEFISDFCDSIIDEDLSTAYKLLNKGINMGLDSLRLFTDVIDYFRDLIMLKTTNDLSLVINTEDEIVKKYNEQVSKLSLTRALKIIDTLFEGLNNAKYTVSPKLSFETALLKIASKSTNTDTLNILERIEALEKAISNDNKNNSVIKKDNEAIKVEEEIINETIIDNKEDSEENIELNSNVFETETQIEDSLIEVSNEPAETQEEAVNEPTLFSDALEDENDSEPFESEESSESLNKVNTEENSKIIEDIILNFKEVLKSIQNPDMGFMNIIKKAELLNENGNLILLFNARVLFDIAKSNKYDDLLKKTIKAKYDKDINIKLKCKEKEVQDIKDPFMDVIEIAEQNQIIFNIE